MAGPVVVLTIQEAMVVVVPAHQTMGLVVAAVGGELLAGTIQILYQEVILVEPVVKLLT
jgi:hypothetical protein